MNPQCYTPGQWIDDNTRCQANFPMLNIGGYVISRHLIKLTVNDHRSVGGRESCHRKNLVAQQQCYPELFVIQNVFYKKKSLQLVAKTFFILPQQCFNPDKIFFLNILDSFQVIWGDFCKVCKVYEQFGKSPDGLVTSRSIRIFS